MPKLNQKTNQYEFDFTSDVESQTMDHVAGQIKQSIERLKHDVMPGYCEIGMSHCRCGWVGQYPLSGCPNCNNSFVS